MYINDTLKDNRLRPSNYACNIPVSLSEIELSLPEDEGFTSWLPEKRGSFAFLGSVCSVESCRHLLSSFNLLGSRIFDAVATSEVRFALLMEIQQ